MRSLITDEVLQQIAHRLRIESIKSTTIAGSGHPTSCSSIAEAMSILFFDVMKYSLKHPKTFKADRLVLSKGHAAPILYAAWALAGKYPINELTNLRKIESIFEGHPTPRIDFVDVATGSLGQGLGVAAGMAWAGKYIEHFPYRVYCIVGDGECAEGSVWEALAFAVHYKLDNLICLIDCNRLGQSEALKLTVLMTSAEEYARRAGSFGCKVSVVDDGNRIQQLREALYEKSTDTPYCIVMRTKKGAHMEGISDAEGWHGKPLNQEQADTVIEKLRKLAYMADIVSDRRELQCDEADEEPRACKMVQLKCSTYTGNVATRKVYGDAVTKIGKLNPRVVCLDGDTKNSTFAITFKNEFHDRFIECYIAEQNMISVALGLQCRSQILPFVSGFACFLTRAFDQLRMAAISEARMVCVGSHAGCSIGEDGGSQMGLEDFAMFRALPHSVVLYPSDGISCEKAVELAANHQTHGIYYIRTSRPALPPIYTSPEEQFQVGKCKVIKSKNEGDIACVIAGGVTLFEAIKANEILEQKGLGSIRIIDVFSVKPIDTKTIIQQAKQTNNFIVVVEDHYPEGGIGESLCAEMAVAGYKLNKFIHLCVRDLAHSGTPEQIMRAMKIDHTAILDAVSKK